MTLISRFEARLAASLPAPWVKTLQNMKSRLPLRLIQSPPVAQPFVDDGRTRCWVRLHNFYSVLLPDISTQAVATLQFFGEEGKLVVQHRSVIEPMGAIAVDVRETLRRAGARVGAGVVLAQLTPRSPRHRVYRALGQVTSHFFVQYEDASGSLGLIHPLAVEVKGPAVPAFFRSSQLVTSEGLERIDLVMYNPTHGDHRAKITLRDSETDAALHTHVVVLPALTARVVPLMRPEAARFLVEVDAIPAPNAKPLLRRVFKSGLSSMSHA